MKDFTQRILHEGQQKEASDNEWLLKVVQEDTNEGP